MTGNDARATINMPRELHTDIHAWAVEAARKLHGPVSFQDAARAMLAAAVKNPAAGEAAMTQLKRGVQ